MGDKAARDLNKKFKLEIVSIQLVCAVAGNTINFFDFVKKFITSKQNTLLRIDSLCKKFYFLDLKEDPYKGLMRQIEGGRKAVYDLETSEMEWFVIPPNTQNFATGKL